MVHYFPPLMKLLVWLIPFLLYGSELLSQEIPVLDFEGLEERIRVKNGSRGTGCQFLGYLVQTLY